MAVDTDELLATCGALAEKFSVRAPLNDEQAAFPTENFADLREAGLMGLMVPESHGGIGANFLDYTLAAGRLAAGDGSTAVAFNMHNIVMATLAELDVTGITGRRGQTMIDFRDWAFGEATSGKLFAASLTEPGAGFHPGAIKTSYRKVDGGFVLNGKKSFVSLSENADYYVVACIPEKDPGGSIPTISLDRGLGR